MVQSYIKVAATLMRWVLRGACVVLILLLLAWGVLHWIIVPRIDNFRPRLESIASRAVDAPVRIGALEAHSNGLVPSVSLHDVQVHDPDGRPGLKVPRVLVAFSVLSLGKGELEQLVIDRPTLEMRRTPDGRLLVGGIDMASGGSREFSDDSAAADWFFSQPEVLVRGGQVRWVDDLRGTPALELSNVELVARNGFGRHQMRLDATPPAGWGDRFSVVGQFRQPMFAFHPGRWQEWEGKVYADLPRADVAHLHEYLDLSADHGLDLQSGQGAVRLWAELDKGRLTSATADVSLGGLSVAFGPDLEPLAFSSLSGRIGWSHREDGLGAELSTHDLQFVDADGLRWPGGNLRLNYRDGADGRPLGGNLSGEQLDLAALAKMARRLPLPSAFGQRLADHPVQGLVEQIDASWAGTADDLQDWHLQTRISRLAVGARPAPLRRDGRPAEGAPGMEGAELQLHATPAGGNATLKIQDGAMEFPGVFAEPRIPLAQLEATSRWQIQEGQILIDLDDLRIRNADAVGQFRANWKSLPGKQGADRFPGVLDLTGSFSRANGARIHRYLPLGIPADAREYVRHAIRKGEARNVQVRVKGDLMRVGESPPEPGSEFRFAGQVRGVTMAYVPPKLQPEGQVPWPPLENLAGELIFDQSTMQVKNASGGVQGHPDWQFTQVQAGIADLNHTRVRVEAEGQGALASALGIVRDSPIAEFIGHALEHATAGGDAGLKLKLDLPIENLDDAKVQGQVSLQGNDVRMTPETPPLRQAQGAIRFSETGFSIEDATAQLLDGEVRLSGGSQGAEAGGPTLLQASGTVSAEALRTMKEWAPVPGVAASAEGTAAYQARIAISPGAKEPHVTVTSDLRGMSLHLPAPLTKPADTAMALRYESGPSDAPASGAQAADPLPGAADRRSLRLSLGDVLSVHYQTEGPEGQSGRVLRGAIGVGAAAVQSMTLPRSGVTADIRLQQLDTGAWDEALAGLFEGDRLESGSAGEGKTAATSATIATATPAAKDGPSGGFLPTVLALAADRLVLDERTLHDVRLQGVRQGLTWRAEVHARELAGRVAYTQGAEGRAGKLQARLSRLAVPDGAEDSTVLAQPAVHMPALDIEVEDFELRGKKLGRLEVKAVNHELVRARSAGTLQVWELTQLALHAPEAVFKATGRWDALVRAPALPVDPRAPRAPDDPRRTRLDFTLDIKDAGALLARFDMPGVLARGEGRLQGALSWSGAPMSPHYATMAGQLQLDVGAGQFLKADPGVAKLLGVLSLQALPRRLTLDFRDLFSTGFAFDFVRGDVRIADGVAHTNNLQMKGVNAAVLMEGHADIAKETQDLRVLVVPEIDAGTAALVATAINPAVGLGTFLAQLILKRPLIQANTQEFRIDGSWDNPAVHKLDTPSQKPIPAEPGKP